MADTTGNNNKLTPEEFTGNEENQKRSTSPLIEAESSNQEGGFVSKTTGFVTRVASTASNVSRKTISGALAGPFEALDKLKNNALANKIQGFFGGDPSTNNKIPPEEIKNAFKRSRASGSGARNLATTRRELDEHKISFSIPRYRLDTKGIQRFMAEREAGPRDEIKDWSKRDESNLISQAVMGYSDSIHESRKRLDELLRGTPSENQTVEILKALEKTLAAGGSSFDIDPNGKYDITFNINVKSGKSDEEIRKDLSIALASCGITDKKSVDAFMEELKQQPAYTNRHNVPISQVRSDSTVEKSQSTKPTKGFVQGNNEEGNGLNGLASSSERISAAQSQENKENIPTANNTQSKILTTHTRGVTQGTQNPPFQDIQNTAELRELGAALKPTLKPTDQNKETATPQQATSLKPSGPSR